MIEYDNRTRAMNQYVRLIARAKHEVFIGELARKRELEEAVLKQLKICKWTLVATVAVGVASIAVTLFLAFHNLG